MEPKVNNGNGDNANFQNKPQYPCPLPCNHKVAYGSASYCSNFRKDTKPVRIDKVKKYKMCKKCLKKGTTHTVDQCQAPNCRICKGAHSALICTKEGGQQRMFNTDENSKEGATKKTKAMVGMKENLKMVTLKG